MKLVVVRPGPLPLVHLVRYAVIHGKETSRVEKPLPFTTRADTIYRVLVDVRGSDFTIMVQGQVVDFWSDDRLKTGGIGFFSGKGEQSRIAAHGERLYPAIKGRETRRGTLRNRFSNIAERLVFSDAIRASILRRNGGNIREPSPRRSVNRRLASLHEI